MNAQLAALLAALVAVRRAPAHRPIVILLFAIRAIEVMRRPLPSRLSLVMMIAIPALSVWATWRALRRPVQRPGLWCAAAWLAAAAWVALAPCQRPCLWWRLAWPVAFGVAMAFQLISWRRWRADGSPPSMSQRVAVALIGGDIGAFVLGTLFGWSGVGWFNQAVSLVLVWVQLSWLRAQEELRTAT